MAKSLWSWWTSNMALHTYVYAQLLISLPFSVFSTYTQYQLQTVGFVIGTDSQGQPCAEYCIVDWAGSRLDLNSVLLYMNAFGIGLSGFVTLFLSAYSDYWSRKHLLITLLFVIIGAISIPVYWLQGYTSYDFQVVTALSIVFTIATNILIALLNIYIPYCMRTDLATKSPVVRNADEYGPKKRTYGFKMAILGAFANSIGALFMYLIVIIITETTTAVTGPGLLVATAVGFLTIAGSVITYLGLPRIPAKRASELKDGLTGPLIEFLNPFRDLGKRRSMALLLIAYTIYTDTTYAVLSVTGQLYVAEVHPGSLEYTLYALAQTIFGVIFSVAFMVARPYVPIRLETWLLVSYVILLIIPVWGIIGFADVDFGYKNRWEFFLQAMLSYLSGVIANTSFRVLFSEMIQPRNEVRWFSLQYILSSATVWVNYVASAPLQNATHQLRFPLVLSLIFLAVALVIELVRQYVAFFKRDQEKWIAFDKIESEEEQASTNSGSDHEPSHLQETAIDKVGSVVISRAKL